MILSAKNDWYRLHRYLEIVIMHALDKSKKNESENIHSSSSTENIPEEHSLKRERNEENNDSEELVGKKKNTDGSSEINTSGKDENNADSAIMTGAN